MDLKFEQDQAFVNDDKSWIANRLGFDTARTVTLDLSTFTEALHYPNGFIPSGVAIAKMEPGPNSLYGLYDNAGATPGAEVQTITRTSTGGTFTITVNGETTGTIPAGAAVTAGQIQTALDALATVQTGDIVVAGAAGGPFTLTFGGNLLGDVPTVVIDTTLATGGAVSVAVTTPGTAGGGGRNVLDGHLLNAVTVKPTNKLGRAVTAMLWQGIVREARLPANSGLDAAGKADVAGHIRYE